MGTASAENQTLVNEYMDTADLRVVSISSCMLLRLRRPQIPSAARFSQSLAKLGEYVAAAESTCTESASRGGGKYLRGRYPSSIFVGLIFASMPFFGFDIFEFEPHFVVILNIM